MDVMRTYQMYPAVSVCLTTTNFKSLTIQNKVAKRSSNVRLT